MLNPPGESIGLAFGARTTLRVQYLDTHKDPMAGVLVSFSIVGQAGGSALSNRMATTDATGIARVDLVAGAARTSFRVSAQASGALPATFYVTVSDVGFAALAVTPRHIGSRTGATAVEARLYPASSPCASLDATAPPESPFPPRTLPGFDLPADWYSLPPNDGYAVLAWARDDAAHVIAAGCVDLAQHQLLAGGSLTFDLGVVDRPLAPAASYRVASTIDLSPEATVLVDSSLYWKTAACPYGAAQLVLDCAIDALDGGDPLDCVVVSPGTTAQALQAKRNAPDATTGCRGGLTSLDAILEAAMTQPAGAPATVFAPGAADLHTWLTQLALTSRLAPAGAAGDHTLLTGTLGTGAAAFTLDLTSTARPILEAQTALTWTPTGVSIGPHGFTLRLGAFLDDAFVNKLLAPAGINASVTALGTAAVAKTFNASGKTGCDAVSYDVCPLATLAGDCLTSACNAMLATLDAGLARPFTRLTATGIDVTLTGGATLVDADGDGTAEAISAGTWSVALKLDDASTAVLAGTFTATSP